jgi:hypothetical protein
VKGEVAHLPSGASLEHVCLPLLDEWMGRTFWGVHLITDEDLSLVQQALKVNIFSQKDKKKIGNI